AFPSWEPFKALTKATTRLATSLFVALAVFPVALVVLLVAVNVLKRASVNPASELPHPVVEGSGTNAPPTSVRILRACRSQALSPAQAVIATIPFMFRLPDTRIAYFNLFKNAIHGRVPFTLAPSVDTRAWIASVLRRRWETAEVQAPLQPRRLLTLAEPVAADQSQAIVDTPSPSLPLDEYNRDSTKSSDTSSKSQDLPPTNPVVVATSAHAKVPSAALPLSLASIALAPIALAPSDRTTSGDLFNGSCGYVDHQTPPSASASRLSDPILAALFSYRERRVGSLQNSRVVIPPEPGDTEPKIVKNDLASSAASADNLVEIPATAQVNGIITRECSRNPARGNFGTGSVPYKSSLNIATEGDGIDPAGWRGKSLDEIAAALRRRRAATVPQPTIQATPTPTLSSSDGNTSSTSGSSALNQLTPLTSTEIQEDRLWEAGAPDSSLVVIPPPPAVPDDTEPKTVKNDLPSPAASADNLLQIPTADQVHGILTRDRSSNPARCDFATGSAPYKSSRKIALEGVDIIDPAGWRGRSLEEIAEALRRRGATTVPQSIPQATPAPTLSSSHGNTSSISGSLALNHSTPLTELQQDRPWEAGTPNYSPYSTIEPRDDTPALEAETVVPTLPHSGEEPTAESFRDEVPWQVQSTSRLGWGGRIRAKLRHNARSSELNEEWRWAKTKGKTPVAGRSGSAPPTPVSTDDEEDEVDSQGFSRSEQRKAEAASRAALAMPFYGATTSRTMQPLSDDEWTSLKQFTATPASLMELAQPQVPLSTRSETEVVQTLPSPPSPPPVASTGIVTEVIPSWALPPLPPLDAAPQLKGASRTKRFIKKVVKRVKATFRPKNRSQVTGDV
ncbi:hypothetical protein FRC01_000544, partial [Tulasnella sp. 417]